MSCLRSIVLFLISLALLGLSVSSVDAAVVTFGDGLQTSIDGYTESGMIASAPDSIFNRVRDWGASGERETLINDRNNVVSFALQSGGLWDLIQLDVEPGAEQFPWKK